MDLPESNTVPIEPLPAEAQGSKESIVEQVNASIPDNQAKVNIAELTDEELAEKCESILTQKIKEGDKLAYFQLGQLHFELDNHEKARRYFERAPENDWQSAYQLGVIYFDGLGLSHHDYNKGLSYMKQVAACSKPSAKHLKYGAQYNIGRAYFQGFGVRTDYHEAEKWWIAAADDGNPSASILAQCMLGMFYSRKDTLDLRKSFFWHSEACGNGNLESQGALGVMFMYGLGVKTNAESAFECLTEASKRGNVYAMGHMVAFYYRRKLFTKCVDMASRVAQLENVEEIAEETGCLANFVRKGISMACFFFARCLDKQLGIKSGKDQAQRYYTRAYEFDPDTCAALQNIATHGTL